jgi:hypothetical protein
MKKILLLVGVLLLGCSDLSSNRDETLKDELPKDFERSEYAKINADVVTSQVLLDIQEKLQSLYSKYAFNQDEKDAFSRKDCGNTLLEDHSLVEMIYKEYMKCPAKGWDPNKACSGEYASNPNYTKDGKCAIGGCWSGGWDEHADYDLAGYDNQEEYCIEVGCPPTAKDEIWAETAGNLLTAGKTTIYENQIDKYIDSRVGMKRDSWDPLIMAICKFVIPEAKNAKEARNYLKDFDLDSTLLEKHYFLVGRSEGRPYKYCNGKETEERTVELALKLQYGKLGYFYDYSRYLFCLNESNYKVYVTQEGK